MISKELTGYEEIRPREYLSTPNQNEDTLDELQVYEIKLANYVKWFLSF